MKPSRSGHPVATSQAAEKLAALLEKQVEYLPEEERRASLRALDDALAKAAACAKAGRSLRSVPQSDRSRA